MDCKGTILRDLNAGRCSNLDAAMRVLMLRDRDATRSAAAKTPVPQDLQARAEGIARTQSIREQE